MNAPISTQHWLRGVVVSLWLTLVGLLVAFIFWNTQVVYSLPTPVPPNYVPVAVGTHIPLRNVFGLDQKKPMLLHFFNPDCPCSRFHIDHLQSLIRTYKDRMDFAVVVVTDDATITETEIRDRFHINVPISFDAFLADRCGVISTPQAVILDTSDNLYYRGNYNQSRYCTDRKTEYARQAIDALLNRCENPTDEKATVAYGCSLPGSGNCKKTKS